MWQSLRVENKVSIGERGDTARGRNALGEMRTCYRAVLPVPFKEKARAVFPSSEVVGTACRLQPYEHSNHDQHHHAISAGRSLKLFHLIV
jgi:hypothetical protein